MLDRSYLQTDDGFFFMVLGYVHPPRCLIAIPRYKLEEAGLRTILSEPTVQALGRALEELRELNPRCLYRSQLWSIEISAVPKQYISKAFEPQDKLQQLLSSSKIDSLQLKALELASLLSEASKVRLTDFGITGSVLIDAHGAHSDIDLTVHGIRNAHALKEGLHQLYGEGVVERLSRSRLEKWCRDVSRFYGCSIAEAKRMYSRKWNRGVFRGALFSVSPVKLPTEVDERYGDRVFKPAGFATIEATITDSSEALFIPAMYVVDDVRFLEGKRVDVREIVSYLDFYADLAQEGERVAAKGKVELVCDRRFGEEYYRIVIGSLEAMGQDFVRVL